MLKIFALAGASMLLISTPAHADPWKDESGNGRYERDDRDERDYRDYREDRRDEDRRYRGDRERRNRYYYGYRIPQGHLPPPGMCRVWLPDRPAGQQPAPMSCRQARYYAEHYGGDVVRGSRRY